MNPFIKLLSNHFRFLPYITREKLITQYFNASKSQQEYIYSKLSAISNEIRKKQLLQKNERTLFNQSIEQSLNSSLKKIVNNLRNTAEKDQSKMDQKLSEQLLSSITNV